MLAAGVNKCSSRIVREKGRTSTSTAVPGTYLRLVVFVWFRAAVVSSFFSNRNRKR